jgi:hypothetical protein
MAGFRFQDPTPALSFYSSYATAIQLPSAASISEDVQFETPRRRVRAGDEYQRPPLKSALITTREYSPTPAYTHII